MPQVDVVDTGSPWIISRSLVIDAPADRIFDVLADPRRHPDFDGSGSVRGAISGPQRLSLGAKFGMDMRLGVPYRVSSRVKEKRGDGLPGPTWEATGGATSSSRWVTRRLG